MILFCVYREETGEDAALSVSVHKDSEVMNVHFPLSLPVTREKTVEDRIEDESLVKCFALGRDGKGAYYTVEDGLLIQKWQPKVSARNEGSTVYQVLMPSAYRVHVLSLAQWRAQTPGGAGEKWHFEGTIVVWGQLDQTKRAHQHWR